MYPFIELTYPLSDDAFQQLLEAGDEPVARWHNVQIYRDDHPDVWPTLVRLLPFSDEGRCSLAAGRPSDRSAFTGVLADRLEADNVWSPHEAARELISWLKPILDLENEIRRIRHGRQPNWLPKEVVEARAFTPLARDHLLYHLKNVVRKATRELRPGDAESFLTISATEVEFREPIWPAEVRLGKSADGTVRLREQRLAAVGLRRPTTIAEYLALGDVRSVERIKDEFGHFPRYRLRVDLSAESLRKLERAIAAERAEQRTWITEHGSDRLRRILEHGLLETSQDVYLDERLAKERPGWTWATLTVDGTERDLLDLLDGPRNVPTTALDLLDRARDIDRGAELRFLRAKVGDQEVAGHVATSIFLDRPTIMLDDDLAEKTITPEGVLPLQSVQDPA